MSPGDLDADPSRRRGIWVAVLVSVGFLALLVVVVVLLSNSRSTRLEEGPAAAAAPTTTLTPPPIPSGSGGRIADGLEREACSDIPQPFPLPARACRIAIPADLDEGEQVPAVILLHGLNTSSEAVASHGGWRDAAAEEGFVLVLPEGQAGGWNAGGCCGLPQTTGLDDVGYLRAVLDQVVNLPMVDPDRVAVVGESAGGMMAYTFGCAEAGRIVGIASVEGTPVSSCRPDRPIPVLHVHGTADEVVPYRGGVSLAALVVGARFEPVPDAVADVAAAMGCRDTPAEDAEGTVATREWSDCGGAAVRLVTIDGHPHEWPTGEPYDATSEILAFLGLSG